MTSRKLPGKLSDTVEMKLANAPMPKSMTNAFPPNGRVLLIPRFPDIERILYRFAVICHGVTDAAQKNLGRCPIRIAGGNRMKRSMAFAKTWAAAVLLLLSMVVAFAATQEQSAPVRPEGDWRGTLDAGAAKLDLILHITRKDGTLTATLDSPDQGATGLAVDSIAVSGKGLRFEMKSLARITRACSAEMARKSRVNFVSRDRNYRLPSNVSPEAIHKVV